MWLCWMLAGPTHAFLETNTWKCLQLERRWRLNDYENLNTKLKFMEISNGQNISF